MKRTPPTTRRRASDRRQALEDQLKGAVLDLVNHMGGDPFFVELNSDDDESFYLVFGPGHSIKRFAAALPEGAPLDADAGGDSPSIH